jgi:acetyl/propionyl-CoA carboxylase alpha subunit
MRGANLAIKDAARALDDNGQPGEEQVGQHYDPMIAKVLARGPDRDAALATLQDALTELEVRHEAPVPFAALGNMHALADA